MPKLRIDWVVRVDALHTAWDALGSSKHTWNDKLALGDLINVCWSEEDATMDSSHEYYLFYRHCFAGVTNASKLLAKASCLDSTEFVNVLYISMHIRGIALSDGARMH